MSGAKTALTASAKSRAYALRVNFDHMRMNMYRHPDTVSLMPTLDPNLDIKRLYHNWGLKKLEKEYKYYRARVLHASKARIAIWVDEGRLETWQQLREITITQHKPGTQ